MLNTSALTGRLDRRRRAARARRRGDAWEDVTPQLSELGPGRPARLLAGRRHRRLLARRRHRLARPQARPADQRVTAIELVTAEGDLVRADADHEPELFWALRGGGGNFGVVTAIEFAVYPVASSTRARSSSRSSGPPRSCTRGPSCCPTLPDELMLVGERHALPAAAGGPGASCAGGSFTVVVAAFLGSEADGRELLRAAARARPGDGHVRHAAAGRAGRAGRWTRRDPLPFRSAHALLDDLPAAGDRRRRRGSPGPGSPLAMVQLRHMGGALARHAPGAGARATLPGRDLHVRDRRRADAASSRRSQARSTPVRPPSCPTAPATTRTSSRSRRTRARFFDPETWERLRR